MRILINAVSAVTGGGMTYLVNLLKYLPDLMSEDEFLVVIQGIQLPEEVYKKPNLTIKKISDKIGSTNLFKRYWWENTGLIKLCKHWEADILYCIANMTPIIPAGIPTFTMLQNVAPITVNALKAILSIEGPKPFLRMLANTALTLYAAFINKKTLVLSQSSNTLLKSLIPYADTAIVHHGISDIFKPNLPRPAKAGEEPYYVFVSNIYVYKGLEYIIDAYKTKPHLPHIYIVGQPFDPKYYNRIKRCINANKLENKIFFLNSLPYSELPNWYANAIANVFPSWCESFGCGIIEAQACGCPIVGMRTATLPEFCALPELLAEPFNGKKLGEAMEKAIELRKEPSLEKKLIAHSNNYTWESAMKQHKEVFGTSKQ